jgi:hypothetical protein
MRIEPHYVEVGGAQVVVLSRQDYEKLAKKADVWEPPLLEPNEGGNYPLAGLDIVMAQEIIRAPQARIDASGAGASGGHSRRDA